MSLRLVVGELKYEKCQPMLSATFIGKIICFKRVLAEFFFHPKNEQNNEIMT